MHLSGRYLVIIEGHGGSRRRDIADLIAGGAAYLSTRMEWSGIGIMAHGRAQDHTGAVVISPDDCFWCQEDDPDQPGRKTRVWRYQPDLQDAANEDMQRRVRVAMHKNIQLVIVHGHFPSFNTIEPLLQYAASEEYEVIVFGSMDIRPGVAAKRIELDGMMTNNDGVGMANWSLDETDEKTIDVVCMPNTGIESLLTPPNGNAEMVGHHPDTTLAIQILGVTDIRSTEIFLHQAAGISRLVERRTIHNNVHKYDLGLAVSAPTVNVPEGTSEARVNKLAEEHGVTIAWVRE